MSVYYYEGLPIVAPLSIKSNTPMFNTTTVSLNESRASQGVQRWELEFGVTTAGSEEDLFVGSVAKLSGSNNTMVMPQLLAVDRKVTSEVAPVSAANHAVGTSLITLTSTETGGLLPKASFVQFNNHSKIYTLVVSSVTGSSFTASLFPTLTAEVPVGTKMFHAGSFEKPMLSYVLSIDNMAGITYSDGVLVSVDKISLFEDL